MQANPSHFWNYFISMLVTSMLLLLIMKTEAAEDEDGERDESEVKIPGNMFLKLKSA